MLPVIFNYKCTEELEPCDIATLLIFPVTFMYTNQKDVEMKGCVNDVQHLFFHLFCKPCCAFELDILKLFPYNVKPGVVFHV